MFFYFRMISVDQPKNIIFTSDHFIFQEGKVIMLLACIYKFGFK